MYKKIKNFFTTNLYWKALSVLLAIGLWFVVMNINNPTEIKTFVLNTTLLNEEKLKENDLAILNIEELKNQKSEIKIKGTRTTLDEISKKYNKDNIKLLLDVDQILSYNIEDKPVEVTANLKPVVPSIEYPNNNFEIVSFYPLTTTIYIDKVITIPKKIHHKTIGKAKEGYIASQPELSSEYIQVTGPKSIIEDIQVIYAEVDISDQTSTVSKNVTPVAYDKDGNKVTDITFNIEKVNIKVPISLQGVVSIVEPNLVGSLPEGYAVESVSCNPKTIEVIGDTKTLQNITRINLPDIDISGLTETTEYTYDISPILSKYNLKLKNNVNLVEVAINIKKATTKLLTIPTSKISILGYSDKFLLNMPEQFTINIVGEESFIQNLNLDLLKFSIDVSDLTEGNHNIKVNVDLPPEISLTSQPQINVVISNNNKIENREKTSTDNTEIKDNVDSKGLEENKEFQDNLDNERLDITQ